MQGNAEFVLLLAAIGLLLLEIWRVRERLGNEKRWSKTLFEMLHASQAHAGELDAELSEVRVSVASAHDWADCWEERALRAEKELLKLQGQHDALQALYVDLVRRTLAANSWIIFRHKGVRSE